MRSNNVFNYRISAASFLLLLATFSGTRWTFAESSETVLWYDRPATTWVEALPIGNGSLGAMVF
jgi:alpha-L-fucosidase 2